MPSASDSYLEELRRLLRWRPVVARRVITEIADHLAETTAAGVRSGLSVAEAEEAAIQRLGPASLVAQRYREVGRSLGRLVMFTSCATAMSGIWLGVVASTLPLFREGSRGFVLFLLSVALVIFGVLSVALAARGACRDVLRWTVLIIAILAIALGGVHVVPTVVAAVSGNVFNPFVLLVSTVVTLHGLAAAAFALDDDRNSVNVA